MTTPALSVVVLTWNGSPWIEDCLDSVLAQGRDDLELIVVDNASTDGTAELVARRYPRATLVRNARNLGFPAGNNVGIRAARGELVALLNQDAVARPGWLDALERAFATRPRAGIVGGKILFPDDGRLQYAGGTLDPVTAIPTHRGHGETDRGQYEEPREVGFVTGAAMALRRAMLDEIGLFDEDYFLYYEDADLCARARGAGWELWYVPDAVVTHIESATGARESARYLRRIHRSRWRYLLKHHAADRLIAQTIPAERRWLRDCPPLERAALAVAYQEARRALPTRFRGRPEEAAALDGALEQLERALLDELRERATVVERPFRADRPVIGPLIARFREAWNGVSTRWYVRPLLEQQNELNRLAVRQLEIQAAQIQALAERVAALEARLEEREEL